MQTIDMFIDEFQDEVKSLGMNPLFVPSEYFIVEELPKLSTRKADFKGLKKLPQELSDENA